MSRQPGQSALVASGAKQVEGDKQQSDNMKESV